MIYLDQRSAVVNTNSQLLLELSTQRLLYRLSGLYLTAGKFPKPPLMRFFGSKRN
jgi:hypothetical protein